MIHLSVKRYFQVGIDLLFGRRQGKLRELLSCIYLGLFGKNIMG